MSVQVLQGDCIQVMRALKDNSVDSVVTDPPYDLTSGKKGGTGEASLNLNSPAGRSRISTGGFMGKEWDSTGVAFDPVTWAEVLRILKPGGHLLAFGATRTYHRMACAIEDAGFEIRDSIHWVYGSGFCKSLNLDKDPRFCHCDVPQLVYGNGSVLRMREGIPDLSRMASQGEVSDVLQAVQWQSEGEGVGEVRISRQPGSNSGKLRQGGDEGGEESRMERRGDSEETEGELQGSTLRPMPSGIPSDGSQGRVHHGASTGDGTVGGALPFPDGSGQSQGPQPVEQFQGEPGTLSDEPRPQTRGVWEVCGRCGKPAIPRGIGTGLKPAHEPIVVARKPLVSTVAANVLEWGTGGINVDGCRVETADNLSGGAYAKDGTDRHDGTENWRYKHGGAGEYVQPSGRWPPNLLLTHSAECEPVGTRRVKGSRVDKPCESATLTSGYSGGLGGPRPARGIGDADGMETVEVWKCVPGCPVAEMDEQSGTKTSGKSKRKHEAYSGESDTGFLRGFSSPDNQYDDTGGASRFFPVFKYQAKAPAKERVKVDGISHPTCKPLGLMCWLVRLVTPPGGICLDLFAGSGTTGEACLDEGFNCILIEREPDYIKLIRERLGRREPTLWDSLWE